MIKSCIFDLDGTLFNTLTSIRYFLNKTLEENGIEGITEEQCKIFVGNGARKLIERCFKHRGIDDGELLEKVLQQYNASYNAEATYLTEPYEGIVGMLEGLKAMGMSLAVISNKPEPTVKQVAALTPGMYAIVRGGREGVPLKPDPTAVYEMLEELDVKPCETVYVGDTSVDMKTGKAFGAYLTVGVTWGFRDRRELEESGADHIVDTASELLNIIKSSARGDL